MASSGEEVSALLPSAPVAESTAAAERRQKKEEARKRREETVKRLEEELLQVKEEEDAEEAEEEEEQASFQPKGTIDENIKIIEEAAAQEATANNPTTIALLSVLRLQDERVKKLEDMMNQKLDLILQAQQLPQVTPVTAATVVSTPVTSSTTQPVTQAAPVSAGTSYAQVTAAADTTMSPLEIIKYGPKVDTPKHFKGLIDENVEKWLRQMNNYLNLWPPLKDQKVKYAIQFLDEGASDWIHGEVQAAGCKDHDEYAAKVTWEEFQTKMMSRYTPVTEEDKAMNRAFALGSVRWKGSVQELIAEFDKCYLVPGIDIGEKAKMLLLQNALPARIAGHVGPERNKTLKSFKAMADESLRLESAFRTAQPAADTRPGRRPYASTNYPQRERKETAFAATTPRGTRAGQSSSSNAAGGAQQPPRQSKMDTAIDDLLCVVQRMKNEAQGRARGPSPRRPRAQSRSRSPGGGNSQVYGGFRPGIAATAPWKKLKITQDQWQARMDEGKCVTCGRTGHVYYTCPDREKGKGEAR
jgi:hypothetical protein